MHANGFGFVLAMAALASVSSAGIIVGSGGSANEIDLDGDGHPDLSLSEGEFFGNIDLRSQASVGAAPGGDLQFTPTPLMPGSTVDGTATFNLTAISESSEAHRMSPGSFIIVDNPGGAVDGDYGFRFTSQGATHYGWTDVHVQATVPPGITVAVVFQWAYESDPNTPITVGAVPEPAGAGLFLLATPAVFRRRRRSP